MTEKCREFTPTHDWMRVPDDAVCPPGLEYRMDMKRGVTMARLPPTPPKPVSWWRRLCMVLFGERGL